MYSDANVWIALIIAGIAGCIVTGIFAARLADVPMVLVVGDVGKYIWAIIFALPVPFILSFGSTGGVVTFIAALWLILAPTIGSKVFFGPKDVPMMTLNGFHCGYAVTVLAVYAAAMWFLTHSQAMMQS